jgi:hypothetical protein
MYKKVIFALIVGIVTIAVSSAYSDTLEYLTDKRSRSVWRDPLAGTLGTTTEKAYEGTRSLKFNYMMERAPTDSQHPDGWAGFGFWHPTLLDFTPYNYMVLAIWGPNSSNAVLRIAICTKASADTADKVYYYSKYEVPDSLYDTQWVLINIPLQNFDPPLNKALVTQVDFHLEPKSGISKDTGTFYLDYVLFSPDIINTSVDYKKYHQTRSIGFKKESDRKSVV